MCTHAPKGAYSWSSPRFLAPVVARTPLAAHLPDYWLHSNPAPISVPDPTLSFFFGLAETLGVPPFTRRLRGVEDSRSLSDWAQLRTVHPLLTA